MFSKGTQTFDFIKHNIIHILAYKVNSTQINEGLIMFFANSRIYIFFIIWVNCEQYGKNQYKEKEENQHRSVFKVLR